MNKVLVSLLLHLVVTHLIGSLYVQAVVPLPSTGVGIACPECLFISRYAPDSVELFNCARFEAEEPNITALDLTGMSLARGSDETIVLDGISLMPQGSIEIVWSGSMEDVDHTIILYSAGDESYTCDLVHVVAKDADSQFIRRHSYDIALPYYMTGFNATQWLITDSISDEMPHAVRHGNVTHAPAELKMMSFNIQVFGQSKASKENVMDILVQALATQHLIFIQEIRDVEEEVFWILLEQLNAYMADQSVVYEGLMSERLGRSSSKEQYGCIYDTAWVEILRTHQYNVTLDHFERPPFSVLLRYGSSVFTVLNSHIKPDDAVIEVDRLVDAYVDVIAELGTANVMLLGDLNADCTYVTASEFDEIRLWTYNETFSWLIDSEVDTTIHDTDCAYDRFIVAGYDLTNAIVPASSGLFNITSVFGLNKSLSLEVSDHFPIVTRIAGLLPTSDVVVMDEEDLNEPEEPVISAAVIPYPAVIIIYLSSMYLCHLCFFVIL